MTNRRLLPVVTLAAIAGLAGPGASPGEAARILVGTAEQDAAYRGVSSGRMLSLDQIRAIVARRIKGEYLGVEIDEGSLREGLYVYRLTTAVPTALLSGWT